MLWLARFDSTGGQPEAEPVDVRVLAAQTADRFGVVAETRGQKLEVAAAPVDSDAIVTAPPDWLDRLVGILLDNACRYSPDGGSVQVHVAAEGRRVRLTVDDSGRASRKKSAAGSSTGSIAPRIIPAVPAWAWQSPTRSSGPPAGSGISEPRRLVGRASASAGLVP